MWNRRFIERLDPGEACSSKSKTVGVYLGGLRGRLASRFTPPSRLCPITSLCSNVHAFNCLKFLVRIFMTNAEIQRHQVVRFREPR